MTFSPIDTLEAEPFERKDAAQQAVPAVPCRIILYIEVPKNSSAEKGCHENAYSLNHSMRNQGATVMLALC